MDRRELLGLVPGWVAAQFFWAERGEFHRIPDVPAPAPATVYDRINLLSSCELVVPGPWKLTWTGFKPSQDSAGVAGQVLLWELEEPRRKFYAPVPRPTWVGLPPAAAYQTGDQFYCTWFSPEELAGKSDEEVLKVVRAMVEDGVRRVLEHASAVLRADGLFKSDPLLARVRGEA